MTVYTALIELKLKCPNDQTNNSFENFVSKNLKKFGFQKINETTVTSDKSLLVNFATDSGITATSRIHSDGLITIDVNERVANGSSPKFNQKVIMQLKDNLSNDNFHHLPLIQRFGEFNPYFPTTNNNLIEYDFTELLFEETTPFQNVKIYKSPQFGNSLILDNDMNLSESDIIYTKSILGYPRENYKDKEILILGGGDGGILNELMKHDPKYVLMVEIDQVVIDQSIKHLRGICGDAMDKLEGKNYKVLVEDCIPIMQGFVKSNRKFDYIINDLTAIPITDRPIGELWDFMHLILDLSFKILKDEGKYYTQGNGFNATEALAMYDNVLKKLEIPVEFSKEKVFVPSYLEYWVFYEIWKRL